MAALDMGTLKHYVTSEDGRQFQNLAQGTVSLHVTHSNLNQQWPEIRVDLHTTIGELKEKLYNHGGTGCSFQKLFLRDRDFMGGAGTSIELVDDGKKLGYYGVRSGMNVHILDEDPYSLSKNGGLEDVSLVKKYVMADEVYEKVENSLRNYKKKKRAEDPHWTFLPENRRETSHLKVPLEEEAEFYTGEKVSALGCKVGARCEVAPGGRRGVIRWIGEGGKRDVEDTLIGLRDGHWIGVEFDEPVGKNDGNHNKKQYFTCAKPYGGFVRPDEEKIKVGDYPELDFENLQLNSSASESEDEFLP